MEVDPLAPRPERALPLRLAWFALGWVCVALGGLGILLPGLPATVFFICAASCFARSSPRVERWLLGLPVIGRMVTDHRAGLGMPRRAKAVALATMLGVAGLSALALDSTIARVLVVGTTLVGAWVVLFRVPTREVVVAAAASGGEQGP